MFTEFTIIGFFMAPLIAIASWSIWAWILIGGAFCGSVIEIERNSTTRFFYGFVAAIIIFIFAIMNAKTDGFFQSVLQGLLFTMQFIVVYMLFGILFLMPLWYLRVKRIGREARKNFSSFMEKALKATDANFSDYFYKDHGSQAFTPLTENEKKDVRASKGLDENGKMLRCLKNIIPLYKKKHELTSSIEAVRNNKNISKNMPVLIELLTLWFPYVLDEVFGKFLVRIPKHIITCLKKPLEVIAKSAGKGVPDNIDL